MDILLIFLLPLITSIILLCVPKQRRNTIAGIVLSIVICCDLLYCVFYLCINKKLDTLTRSLYSIIPSLNIDLSLLVDRLSILFIGLVLFLSLFIIIYSIGYMSHDDNRGLFFVYVGLFVASMLIVVTAGNYFIMFAGWEGVGACSYLLISFWQHKESAILAGNKAFIINRLADIGFIMAILLFIKEYKTIEIEEISHITLYNSSGINLIVGICLLIAVCGKSAQFPLQGWLGDAMEGPTPVSALIHAATMVTAGVFLIVRSHFIFLNGGVYLHLLLLIIGLTTMIFGAVTAMTKYDMKKILAASTMSQIGYMIFATSFGSYGYIAAIAHLLTHGFFKAGLFLCSGSIMHSNNNEVDIRKLNGLKRYMPITYILFGINYLAIIGIPPLSGYWSKDKIVNLSFLDKHIYWVPGILAIIISLITVYYMSRLFLTLFFGKKNNQDITPHESPLIMNIPIMIITVGAFILGILLIGWNNWIFNWLDNIIPYINGIVKYEIIDYILLVGIILILLFAVLNYKKGLLIRSSKFINNDFYIDNVVIKIIYGIGRPIIFLLMYYENFLLHILFYRIRLILDKVSKQYIYMQNGLINNYIFYSVVCIVLIFLYFITSYYRI